MYFIVSDELNRHLMLENELLMLFSTNTAVTGRFIWLEFSIAK